MYKKEHKIKKPWPTKKVMEQIYDQNLWGENDSEFYSGFGSHYNDLVEPYIKVVKKILNSFQNPITVCDFGCGDFNIGVQLFKHTKNYIAVDIAENLITYNKRKYLADNLEFQCLDISKDNLPKADCIILRQVLQHLCNDEVNNILSKLNNYKYIVLTEHLPQGKFTPNLDIISGQGIRIKKQSGLDVFKPPFKFEVKHKKILLSVKLDDGKGVIVTTFFQMF